MTTQSLATEIRQLRADLGLSQEKLARLLETTGDTVGRWERGEMPQNPPAIMALLREIRKERGL